MFGPISLFSIEKYEWKHQPFKNCTRSIRNFRSIRSTRMKKETLAHTFRLHQSDFIHSNLFSKFNPPRPNNIVVFPSEDALKIQNGYEANQTLVPMSSYSWPFDINNLTMRKVLTNRSSQNLWLLTMGFFVFKSFPNEIFCKGVVYSLNATKSGELSKLKKTQENSFVNIQNLSHKNDYYLVYQNETVLFQAHDN